MLVGVFCLFDVIMTRVWLCACRSWSRVTISSRTGSVTRTQSSALSSRWCRKYRGSVMNMASRVDMSTRTRHWPTRSDDPGGYCLSCWKVNLVSCWHKKMCGLMCLLMLLFTVTLHGQNCRSFIVNISISRNGIDGSTFPFILSAQSLLYSPLALLTNFKLLQAWYSHYLHT